MGPISLGLLTILLSSAAALAQMPQPMPPGPPPNPVRPPLTPVDQADENFTFLRDPSNRTDLWDPLKYVPLDRTGDFTSLLVSNSGLNTNGSRMQLGRRSANHQRLLASTHHSGNESDTWFPCPYVCLVPIREGDGQQRWSPTGIDEDQGDFHEAFIDISSGLDDQRSITARLGEQELVYGTGRLVDNDEGVNVKSSFYGARIIAKTETLRLDVFGVKPTEQNTGTFDDRPTSQQTFWGAYGTVPLRLVDQKDRRISITSDSIRRARSISRAAAARFGTA